MKKKTGNWRLGVDIGGTFTDIVLTSGDGTYVSLKVSSTPDDYSRGILEGTLALLARHAVDRNQVAELVHGTTVATNAIVENRGAQTALITTRGFRDVLELRRLRVPELYSLNYEPPKALVERRLRLEVDERIDSGGNVVTLLDEKSVHAAIDRIEGDGATAVAVCLLHSYRNPAHERRVGELIRARLPDVYLSLSIEVLPEIREYERTSTTVVNSYIGPIVQRYLASLRRRLSSAGLAARLRIMQSNGGIMSAGAAETMPAQIVESGPAAGVVGVYHAAQRAGLKNVISFDMGGTTAKASMIEGGNRSLTTEYEVGGGISLSSRLIKGRGYALKLPVIDIAEVGAGGGSIVWIDRGGALKVGPRSAGAVPGPACYATGGDDPTVTDANVVLGYVNPEALAGGSVPIYPERARQALKDRIASPLGLSVADAALGTHAVANNTMIRALKAVSTYRGRDPRDFDLYAFGGNGGIHGPGIARLLGMKRVIVPPSPGVFSAVGLLEAEPEYQFVRTLIGRVDSLDPETVDRAFSELEEKAARFAHEEGVDASRNQVSRAADLKYAGQNFELTVPFEGASWSSDSAERLARAFHAEHLRTYGHNAGAEPVHMVNIRLQVRIPADFAQPLVPAAAGNAGAPRDRKVVFEGQKAPLSVPVLATRADLGRPVARGPLLIEEYDATVVIPPDCGARLDERQNVVIEMA